MEESINPFEIIIQKAKGNPRFSGYRDYSRTISRMKKDKIWEYLHDDFALPYLEDLSAIYDIKFGTLKQWHYNLKKNMNWLPEHNRNPNSFVFNEKEEEHLVNLVNAIVSTHSIPITNYLIKSIMMSYYKSLPEKNSNLQFNASNKYIRRFKRRHNFSTRRLHQKRRPDVSEEISKMFLATVKHIFSIAEKNHIVNVDETSYRCSQSSLTTWSKKGNDGIVIYTGANEKECFTTLGTITATGDPLPLVLIASGTTQRAEANWFGAKRNIEENDLENCEKLINPFYHSTSSRANDQQMISPKSYTDHSPKGWSTRATFKRYLFALRYIFIKPIEGIHFYDARNTIYLLADAYKVHYCDECLDYAHSLNIQIIKIPEGSTDIFQPLDKKIFGILKAKARQFCNQIISDDLLKLFDTESGTFTGPIPPPRAITKKEATVVLENAWHALSKETILSS